MLEAQWVDNGPGWVGVLLCDAETVLGLEPRPLPYGDIADVGVIGAYPQHSETAFEVRAFVTGPSGEDPVTGSLNASLAQWLIGSGRAPHRYLVAQGTRLGRRGRVHIEAVEGQVWVGGDTRIGISGTMTW